MSQVKKRYKMPVLLVTIAMVMSSLALLLQAQAPSPHNVQGKVFTNSSNGVQNGIAVFINNTISGAGVLTAVNAPPAPPQRGSYSATINGNTGDTIVVTSWNRTHFGNATTVLAATTTTIDVKLNMTRSSEANVSVFFPANGTTKNKSVDFNVTINVTMMGNDGINCNATLNFSEIRVLNVSPNHNYTNILGNIPFGGHKLTNWTIRGYQNGTSNISVFAYCESDGRYFENINRRHISNIRITIVPPIIVSRVQGLVDLTAATNTTLFCNATISDGNTASDIRLVNLTFYMNSSGSAVPDDFNYHYTNASCHNASSSMFEINYTCGVSLAYFANNGSWNCNITVADFDNFTNFSYASATVSELLAIDVNPTVINYGTLSVGDISDDVNVSISNAGNVPFNITLHGYGNHPGDNLSMNCTKGNISIELQHYFTEPDVSYESMVNLTWNVTRVRNISFWQRTDDFARGNDTNHTFWKLSIPPLTRGICNGSVIFSSFKIA